MNHIRHRFDVLDGEWRLHLDRHPAGLAHHKVSLDVVHLGENLQHAHAVDRAGGPGDAND